MLFSEVVDSVVALLYFLLNFITIELDNCLGVINERFGIFEAITKHFQLRNDGGDFIKLSEKI